jgi:hypothetical protein
MDSLSLLAHLLANVRPATAAMFQIEITPEVLKRVFVISEVDPPLVPGASATAEFIILGTIVLIEPLEVSARLLDQLNQPSPRIHGAGKCSFRTFFQSAGVQTPMATDFDGQITIPLLQV